MAKKQTAAATETATVTETTDVAAEVFKVFRKENAIAIEAATAAGKETVTMVIRVSRTSSITSFNRGGKLYFD